MTRQRVAVIQFCNELILIVVHITLFGVDWGDGLIVERMKPPAHAMFFSGNS
jgi:hypothetical protein